MYTCMYVHVCRGGGAAKYSDNERPLGFQPGPFAKIKPMREGHQQLDPILLAKNGDAEKRVW